MAIYTNLPVYKSTYRLILSVVKMLPDLPRDCRYSMGQELRDKIMQIIVQVYRANRTRRKLPAITRMRESLVEAQVYLRLMCDMHYISERRYIDLMDQTVDISKQLGAWSRSEADKYSDEQPEDELHSPNVNGQGY